MPFDTVTEIQNSLDVMGELFFTCVGVIQRDSPNFMPNSNVKPEEREEFQRQLKEFAEKIIQASQNTEKLIDSLPGVSLSKQQQLERLAQLQSQNSQLSIALKQQIQSSGL